MNKINRLIYLIFIVILSLSLASQKVYAPVNLELMGDPRYMQSLPTADFQSIPASNVGQHIQTIQAVGRVGELTGPQLAPNMGLLTAEGLRQLKKEQLTYKDDSGQPNINKVKDWDELDANERDKALSEITGRKVSTRKPVKGKVVGNGVEFDSIEFLKIDDTSVSNCVGCVYDGKKLIFKHADSVVTDKSASTNIDEFEGFADSFKVEKADSLLSGCLRFDNIKDSSFSVYDDKVAADVGEGNLTITDCSYIQSEFESKGNGSISINKEAKPIYEVKEGILKCKYGGKTDKVEAQNTAKIEIDNCFTCLTISPAGTYFYSDLDIRKDFNINVPKESLTYRLCLRKNLAQQFQSYNGIVDFVDKKIELNGVVNYLKYPLKNSQISSLLSSFVYKGLKNVNALLFYDKDLLFLNNLNIKNILNNKNQITTTNPNNFYAIEETELEDGKVHRIVDLSLTSKEQLTQDALSSYDSDSLDAGIKIADGVLIQQIDESKVTILPPEHQMISSFLG